MSEGISEKTSTARGKASFYKCPVGGYVSLCPGACPKCGEPLEVHTETDDRRQTTLRDLRNLTASAERVSVSKQSVV